MCGIAGYLGEGSEEVLRSMIGSIAYRGPDHLGTWVHEDAGLGHARLSILDLSDAANQPFTDRSGRYAIVFNGEIYNYQALGEELCRKYNFQLRTTCDTEVLVELYSVYGPEMLSMLNGMFAMAIYDTREKELFLARDRMGQKPLYYSRAPAVFVFGSELKAVYSHPNVGRDIDLDALNAYATFEYVPAPMSIIKGIRKLEPGHWARVKEGNFHPQPYFHIRFRENNLDYATARERFEAHLEDAVRDRLIADVPLGVFLSGGLDSSSVAYYAQKNSARRISTFSIGFEDPSYDESGYAQLVAESLGTDHHNEVLTAAQSKAIIPEVYSRVDEPFADASLIPTYLLSRYTRRHMTVALGGDGSDELLAGYPTFQAMNAARLLFHAPAGFIKALRAMTSLLPKSDNNISLDFKISQFLRGFEKTYQHASTLWLGSFGPAEKPLLFDRSVYEQMGRADGLAIVDEHLGHVKDLKLHDQVLYLYFKTYLPDDILVKVDRASMYNSLEVRSPFLDYRLVEFVNDLPYDYKFRNGAGKRILKDVMRGKIPSNIIDRPKKGFGIPVSRWLRNELREECESLLSDTALKEHGFFNAAYVRKLKDDHMRGRANNRKLLWTLMVFQWWYRQYGK